MTFTATWRRWSVDCVLVTTDPAALNPGRALCAAVMDEVELAVSGFRDDSEVRRLQPGWNRVSPRAADAVGAALGAARATGGRVDPTVGRAVDAWRSGGAPVPAGRWREVELVGDRLRLPAGVVLDLGAIGKAYAVDLAARRVSRLTGSGVLVGMGGDLATAGVGPTSGWQVTVRDLPTDRPATITLHDGWAVATSSTQRRRRRADDATTHHLLDPATGAPARSPWRTVTAVARTCVEANGVATAAVVAGADAERWLAWRGCPARLVDRDGRVTTLAGFPADRVAAGADPADRPGVAA